MPSYLICIGSNYNREDNLLLARQQLTALFPSIRFAEEMETEPFLLSNPALFTNQLARFRSDESPGQVKTHLKTIERLAGRGTAVLRTLASENVALDIDLLMCGSLVLKPQDMEREYIKRSLETFRLKLK